MSLLRVENLSKSFVVERGGEVRHVNVLRNLSFTVPEGGFVTIIGPSGCGKSTLLNILVGLLPPSAGSITVAGHAYDGRLHPGFKRRIGYITQNDNLFPWRLVFDNVRYPLELAGVPLPEQRERVEELLEMVGLAEFAQHYPHELSGGMRKRVSLIRTLIYDPPIILMDEPFGALDAYTRTELHRELLSLWQRTKKTILFITHDLIEAILLADRTILLSNRPSSVQAEYEVALPRPRHLEYPLEDQHFTELYLRVLKEFKR